MNIQWYGQSCFKIQSGDIVVVIDPFDKKIGLTPPRGKTDIVLSSHQHEDHNNADSFDQAFWVKDPGEYEIKNVAIRGIPAFHDDEGGKKYGPNTIYIIDIEGISICHLGDLGQKELTPEQVDAIGNIDILMIPIGGEYTIDKNNLATIDADGMKKIINQIEPRITIPMHYHIKGMNIKMDGIDKFLKITGASEKDAVAKYSIKKKDLPTQEETQFIVMKLD